MQLVLFSAHRLMVIYICTKFHENILDGIKVIERTHFSEEKIRRGHNSVKMKMELCCFFLCTSSDGSLYLYKVS